MVVIAATVVIELVISRHCLPAAAAAVHHGRQKPCIALTHWHQTGLVVSVATVAIATTHMLSADTVAAQVAAVD